MLDVTTKGMHGLALTHDGKVLFVGYMSLVVRPASYHPVRHFCDSTEILILFTITTEAKGALTTQE